MSGFEDFLVEDFGEVEVVERKVTLGGKERLMKFKPISATKGDEIRKSCRKVSIYRGQKQVSTDQEAYMDKLIIETTVYPDFRNEELQKAWGVMGAENLLKAMKSKMKDGEYAELFAIVSEINGYDKGMDELIEEAKN